MRGPGMKAKTRPVKDEQGRVKQLFQELDKALADLTRVEDLFFERRGVHVVAGEACRNERGREKKSVAVCQAEA